MLTEKYRPKTMEEYHYNYMQKQLINEWYNSSEQAALLFGPPGTGKTALAILVARETKSQIIEYNMSDERKGNFMKELRIQLQTETEEETIYILDEIDGIKKREQKKLLKAIKGATNKLILICNNHKKVIQEIKEQVFMISFEYIPEQWIAGFLDKILEKEGIHLLADVRKTIIEQSRTYRDVLTCVEIVKDHIIAPDQGILNEMTEEGKMNAYMRREITAHDTHIDPETMLHYIKDNIGRYQEVSDISFLIRGWNTNWKKKQSRRYTYSLLDCIQRTPTTIQRPFTFRQIYEVNQQKKTTTKKSGDKPVEQPEKPKIKLYQKKNQPKKKGSEKPKEPENKARAIVNPSDWE